VLDCYLVQVFDIVRLYGDAVSSLRILIKELALTGLDCPVAPVLKVIPLNHCRICLP
jgi:hypothetical protein